MPSSAKHLDYFKNKKITVTGASGFIGQALSHKLCSLNCHLTLVTSDRSKISHFRKIKPKITFIETDIRNPSAWKTVLPQTDILFHLAAQTSSQLANQNPILDLQSNFLPVFYLTQICQKTAQFPDIVFAGTATQVGMTKTYPTSEQTKDQPITIYDINKLFAEKYLHYYHLTTPGNAVTLRLTNVYGPGTKPSSSDRGIINNFIKKAITGEMLTIFGEGEFIRDYIFIEDAVNAFLQAAIHIKAVEDSYFIIGSGQGISFIKAVSLIRNQAAAVTGTKVPLQKIAPPSSASPIQFRNFVANSKRFTQLTGWKAKTSFPNGVKKTIAAFSKKT